MFDGFYCKNCKNEFDEPTVKDTCPNCGSEDIYEIIDGEILGLETEDD